jgi:hypothetical protein
MAYSATSYQIEILQYKSGALTKVAEVIDPMELGSAGNVLMFTKELSSFGQCHFRVSAFDPILTQYGDMLAPHQYHVRIRRNGTIVWQGAIIENPKRTERFIDVVAAEYEWYLSKILINRSSIDPGTLTADDVYRIFTSGTMAAAVTAIMNETITNFNGVGILGGMTLGTIDNPNYPPNMTDANGNPLTGPWNFTSLTNQLQFDYQTILYCLQQMAIYTIADFQLDSNLVFSFRKFIGRNKQNSVQFRFFQQSGQAQSNIVSYNLPRLGQQTVNHIYGVATDDSGVILHKDQQDANSIATYGLMEGVAAYKDVSNAGILSARVAAELPLVSTPATLAATVVLNETTAYPLGVWDIGDIVNIDIQNNGVTFNNNMRIVGVSVAVHNTGREFTTVQTNTPLDWQLPLATANGS